ncbi:MAG TPA: YqgE/AlgH family protein, partial [Saprospiraceae bacterium]|nr:YqgE/AlgH family protein [Saprospiraceae bacterium]
PVATDTLHYVHTKGDVLDNSVDLGDGVYWGGDFSKLVFLIENKIITRKDIKFFLGYSGWSEGQLVEEMETKSWVITDMDFNYIFDINFNKLWSKVLNNMGNGYAVIGDMTEAVSLN